MADDKLKRQDKQQLSRFDHGKYMASALIDGMIQNPDEILVAKGMHDLKIYKDILKDDQVHSVFQQRRNAVVNAEWNVEPASESAQDEAAADFVRTQLKMIDFDDITNKMLYANHYGYAIAEVIYKNELIDGKIYIDSIKVRDRARFKFGINSELYLHEDNKKILMPASKFWIHSVGADTHDNPYGQGLAHALYWPVFFKRNGIKFWLIYLEKFGMPTVAVKMNRSQMDDPESVELAHDVIDAIQTDSGVILPEDFVVELIEASRSGTVDYDGLTGRMDSAISKIILSQTMTTDNGSSRSQAEVHNDVKMEVIKGDADLLCNSFNQQVIERLVAINFANAKAPKVFRRTEPEGDLVEQAERDNKIMALGFEPTDEYIEEVYGSGWRRKATPTPPSGSDNVPGMGPEFADVTPLTEARINHRRDQQSLIDAAEYKALNFEELIGDRIDQVNEIIANASSMEDVQKQIDELIKEPASDQAVEQIRNANFFARMMGYFRAKS